MSLQGKLQYTLHEIDSAPVFQQITREGSSPFINLSHENNEARTINPLFGLKKKKERDIYNCTRHCNVSSLPSNISHQLN